MDFFTNYFVWCQIESISTVCLLSVRNIVPWTNSFDIRQIPRRNHPNYRLELFNAKLFCSIAHHIMLYWYWFSLSLSFILGGVVTSVSYSVSNIAQNIYPCISKFISNSTNVSDHNIPFLSLNYSTGFVFQFFHQNSDTQTILTIQNHVITKNHRISILHSEHKTWQLKIKDIRESDRGFYMVRWYDCCLNSLMFLHSFFV